MAFGSLGGDVGVGNSGANLPSEAESLFKPLSLCVWRQEQAERTLPGPEGTGQVCGRSCKTAGLRRVWVSILVDRFLWGVRGPEQVMLALSSRSDSGMNRCL